MPFRPRLPATSYYKTNFSVGAYDIVTQMYIGVDPVPKPGQKPANVFWGNQIWPVGPNLGTKSITGYFGLQKASGSPNKRAIFSWWGSLAAWCGDMTPPWRCGPFQEGDPGSHVVVDFNWQANTNYILHLYRWLAYPYAPAHWWKVDIHNPNGTLATKVGALLVPDWFNGVNSIVQWTEWFAAGTEAANSCSEIPRVDTWFGPVVFDGQPANPTATSYHVKPEGECPAECVPWNGGSSQRFGV